MNDQQEDPKPQETAFVPKKAPVSSQVIAAESVQAEEVPTIPLDSLHTLNTLQPEVSVRALAKTQVGTVPGPLVFEGPGLVTRIKTELAACLTRDGYDTVSEAVGADA